MSLRWRELPIFAKIMLVIGLIMAVFATPPLIITGALSAPPNINIARGGNHPQSQIGPWFAKPSSASMC
jgi:hypothetical protein